MDIETRTPTYAGAPAHPVLIMRPRRDPRVVRVAVAVQGYLGVELGWERGMALGRALEVGEVSDRNVPQLRRILQRGHDRFVSLACVMTARAAWRGQEAS